MAMKVSWRKPEASRVKCFIKDILVVTNIQKKTGKLKTKE